MLIDWFTVIAQAANFLILVWLLKRFLYKPILDAIDAREQRIAAGLADANARKAEALAEREEFKRRNDEFERQVAAQKSKVTEEAAAERKRLFDGARNEVDGLRARQLELLDTEFQAMNAEIARRMQAEVFAIARQTLSDLAGKDLEEQMAAIFVQRLREMDDAGKAQLIGAHSPSSPVLVRSAFELSAAQRTLIEETIKDVFISGVTDVSFETVPNLISGIELIMQGRKVAWSIADHLAALDKSVGVLLQTSRKAGGKAP